jgi:hypothetical protein
VIGDSKDQILADGLALFQYFSILGGYFEVLFIGFMGFLGSGTYILELICSQEGRELRIGF